MKIIINQFRMQYQLQIKTSRRCKGIEKKISQSVWPRRGRSYLLAKCKKLAKGDNPVFLDIIRTNENSPEQMTRRDKIIHRRVARLAAARGLTESQKRMMNKETGPNKKIISVAERERQVLSMGSLKAIGNVWEN